MFKPARWRSEKNKIKALFKLQFHATRVGQLGADALVVSVIPGDEGKPTVRLEKALVRNGSCRWENPVYETVKYVQEPKSGKINEKVYHFIVSNGSAKAGVLGEVSIDFADYAEAIKPSLVSLPFKNSNSNGVLHVSIQRLQANVDQRVEENEDSVTKLQGRSLGTYLSNGNIDEVINSNAVEDMQYDKTASNNAEVSGNSRASSGSDITLSSSESSSGVDTPQELVLRSNTSIPDPALSLSSHRPMAYASTNNHEENQRTHWDWAIGSDNRPSSDNSSTSSQGTFPNGRHELSSGNEIEKLKAELKAFARQVNVSELELQALRKQVVKESKKGMDLSKEVVSLKEERDAFRAENEKLKAFQKRMDEIKVKTKLPIEGGDLRALVEEIRQELQYEKDLNANLRLQLQKTQESNTELILAVQDLEEMLEQKKKENGNLSNNSKENAGEHKGCISRCNRDGDYVNDDDDDDEEQRALEELVREHNDAKDTQLLEQRITDLYNEIEIYRRDRDELEMQMEQLALDYEILKQENHDISCKLEQSQLQDQLKMQCECSCFPNVNELETQIIDLQNELKQQSTEYSRSLATISELETHIKSLEEDLEKQAQGFEADLDAMTSAKVEQEQRAIRAEEALQKARRKNAATAEKLQEEFKRLSKQMASTFEANEKVVAKALTEASELRAEKRQVEEMLQKANEEIHLIRKSYEAKICDLSSEIDMKTDQMKKLTLELDDTSRKLENQKRHEGEISEGFSQEILTLKAEIKKLKTECDLLSKEAEHNEKLRAELEELRISTNETELLIKRGNEEKSELLKTISVLKRDAEKSMEELNSMRHLNDDKDRRIDLLYSELEVLKTQCNDLQDSLLDDESEKEKLRKHVFQLKSELKKKEEAFTILEKKLKDSYGRAAASDATKVNTRANRSASVTQSSKEVAGLRERIKSLEGQIKLKEAALETTTNSFLEKEKDLQNKIEALESRLQEIAQNSANIGQCPQETEVVNDTSDQTLGGNQDINVAALLSEMGSLKERNKSMEDELKDMQKRYSEISLKFAEVEGERQQLVMTLRNLKNAKKV